MIKRIWKTERGIKCTKHIVAIQIFIVLSFFLHLILPSIPICSLSDCHASLYNNHLLIEGSKYQPANHLSITLTGALPLSLSGWMLGISETGGVICSSCGGRRGQLFKSQIVASPGTSVLDCATWSLKNLFRKRIRFGVQIQMHTVCKINIFCFLSICFYLLAICYLVFPVTYLE